MTSLARDYTITRLTPSSPLIEPTIEFALSAWRLLFAERLQTTATPYDLADFATYYLQPPSSDTVRGAFIVAHRGDKIIGAIAYRPYKYRFPNYPQLEYKGKKLVEVVRLFVDPEERGKGLAKVLIEAMKKEAREEPVGLDGMYLHTQPYVSLCSYTTNEGGPRAGWMSGWRLILT
jgi:GNAT superfamily N-acetyltransferase